MNKQFLIIIIVLSMIMIACTPSKSEERHIITNYALHHTLFVCKVDSSDIEIQVMAQDKYQAMKYFDDVFAKDNISESYKILEYPIYLLQ